MLGEARQPVIVPRESPLAGIIIRHVHNKNAHAGREYVLAELRQHYWIIGARTMVRSILHHCVICRRRAAKPCEQLMAELPHDRVQAGDPAFTYVGVDYFGPFNVKKGRGREKRYGCLFTCLTCRAIHVEIAPSLDMDSFLNALYRFMARRGQPKLIRSDNGTNFVSGEKELRQEMKQCIQQRPS